MKILFLLVALSNFIFFFWQYNTGASIKPVEKSQIDMAEKQIYLVSELTSTENTVALISDNRLEVNAIPVATAELNSEFKITALLPEGVSTLNDIITQRNAENEKAVKLTESLKTQPELKSTSVTAAPLNDSPDKEQQIDSAKINEGTTPDRTTQSTGGLLPVEAIEQEKTVELTVANTDNFQVQEKEAQPTQNIQIIEEKTDETDNTENQKNSITALNTNADVRPEPEKQIQISASTDQTLLNQPENSPLSETSQDVVTENATELEKNENKQPLEKSVISKEDETNETQPENKVLTETYCFETGPFKNRRALKNWRYANNIKKKSVQTFVKEIVDSERFLVLYPAAASFAESKENVQMLKKAGIKDLWLFRKGDLKGSISLGLFTKESRAMVLKKTFSEKGFNVEIKPRHNMVSALFARVKQFDKNIKDLPEVSVTRTQQLIECNGSQ